MLEVRDLAPVNLQGLAPEGAAWIRPVAVAPEGADQQLAQAQELLQRKDRKFALRVAKIADQGRLFEETPAKDEAGLREHLERLRRGARPPTARIRSPSRRHASPGASRCRRICGMSSIARAREHRLH